MLDLIARDGDARITWPIPEDPPCPWKGGLYNIRKVTENVLSNLPLWSLLHIPAQVPVWTPLSNDCDLETENQLLSSSLLLWARAFQTLLS